MESARARSRDRFMAKTYNRALTSVSANQLPSAKESDESPDALKPSTRKQPLNVSTDRVVAGQSILDTTDTSRRDIAAFPVRLR
jgi:hypothetical protein